MPGRAALGGGGGAAAASAASVTAAASVSPSSVGPPGGSARMSRTPWRSSGARGAARCPPGWRILSPQFLPVRRLRPGAESQRRWDPNGEVERDPAASDASELHTANTAKMPPDSGEAEEASRPVTSGYAGSGAVVAEQGVGARSHLEGPGGGELAVEKEADVAGSSEGKRLECGSHDVGLFPRGQVSEELEAHALEHAGAEDPHFLALDDAEGELEWGRGIRGAALRLPDRLLG